MRRSPLKRAPLPDHGAEPGYREWKTPAFGRCGVCDRPGLTERHHVVLAQHVRALSPERPELVWDLRNALAVGVHCRCHRDHHGGARRIPIARVPAPAIEFALELLGAAGADRYLERYYAP